MKHETKFKLIEGIFSQEEAINILTALFDYKIDYHNKEDFSNHIRFNKDISHSKQRIQELIESKNAVLEMIEKSKSSTRNLIINSSIKINLEKEDV